MSDRELVPGRATREGTRRFAARFPGLPGHFRRPDSLELSSLALGTRMGEPGGIDDLLYRSAVPTCLEGGVNVFDTAHSDRMQTSERALGAALQRAFHEGVASRDEVVVVTKGGFLVPEPDLLGDRFRAQQQLVRAYVDTGLVDPSEMVAGNVLAPAFLRDQIDRSRANLGLATLDVYLVQEPELHLRSLGSSAFRKRLASVMEMLEEAVREGAIAGYGICTWDGLLLPHSDRGHLSLFELLELALDVSGGDHHLRVLQLPYGLAFGEGLALDSQLGPGGKSNAVLEMLTGTGTAVLASAPLAGGQLLGRLPPLVRNAFPEARSDAQRALQFVRSSPNVTTAVVGMREPDHVDENLAVARVPPTDPATVAQLFARAREGHAA